MSGFDWSPDGKRLAVIGRRTPTSPRELLVVSVDAAQRMLKVRMKVSGGGGLSWSPDGKRIALSSNWMIQILEVEGTGPARIVPGQRGRNSSPAWSPDGKWIAFVSTRR